MDLVLSGPTCDMNNDGTIGLQDCFPVVLEGLEQNKNPTFHLGVDVSSEVDGQRVENNLLLAV